MIFKKDLNWYQRWLERTALEFLENPDNEIEIFLDKMHSNFLVIVLQETGIKKVIKDLSRKIEDLR
jgi:hypothetical protein